MHRVVRSLRPRHHSLRDSAHAAAMVLQDVFQTSVSTQVEHRWMIADAEESALKILQRKLGNSQEGTAAVKDKAV